MVVSHTISWQQATVMDAVQIADRIRRIVLQPAVRRRIDPGMHVDVRVGADAGTLERSYSIVEPVGDDGAYAISVFESEASRGGARAMHALVPGDVVEVTDPLQDFPFRGGAPRYVFLAGGVGITAVLSMARAARIAGADYQVAYCGRSRSSMAYLDELAGEHGERLTLHVRDEQTSLDAAEFVARVPRNAEVYLCGPIRLMDVVRREWHAAGRPPTALRFETFGNSGWFEPQPFVVGIPAIGVECVVSPHQSILEALEAAGVDALSDCRKGECGLCEARVLGLRGTIDHRDVFYSERQRDAMTKVCVCVSRVAGDSSVGVPRIDLQLT
ncbi:PDR/VanB family oxidoreductase [Microbacterium lacus]|uniref:PDR/VanB family oxidoreductase n=1 Tax=Microbacterium lacus TaxID=415217 RepID=UPI00384D2ACA